MNKDCLLLPRETVHMLYISGSVKSKHWLTCFFLQLTWTQSHHFTLGQQLVCDLTLSSTKLGTVATLNWMVSSSTTSASTCGKRIGVGENKLQRVWYDIESLGTSGMQVNQRI